MYMEAKKKKTKTLITAPNAIHSHSQGLLELDISIHFTSKSRVYPYFFHVFLLPDQM
jgi:hypothetical protein